jgi:hypothetical protein
MLEQPQIPFLHCLFCCVLVSKTTLAQSTFTMVVQSLYDCLLAGRPRSRSSSPGRVKNFLFSTSSRSALGSTQPLIQLVPGALSPWVKRQGHEAFKSPPASAEVKKCGSIYPLPHTSSWHSA